MTIRNIKYLSLLIIICLLSAQCKKDDMPEIDQNSDPIFNIDGTLGEAVISLHAGQKDAFMHTSVDQFNNVNLYSGELTNGKTAFKIQVFPSYIDVPTLYNNFTEKDIYKVAQPFGSEALFTLSADDFPFYDLINKISWTVDNVQQPSSTLKIVEPGKYSVCADILFSNGETARTCNTIIVGYQLHAKYKLQFTLGPDLTLEAKINAPDNEVSKVSWYINDELQSDAINLQTANLPEKFHLKAKVEFENGAVGTREVFINKSFSGYSIPDFTNLGQKSSLTWDNTILITILNNDKTYVSTKDISSPSQFKINKISDYKANSKGNEVKLISGKLTVPFKNKDSGVISSGDFKIDFGIAY